VNDLTFHEYNEPRNNEEDYTYKIKVSSIKFYNMALHSKMTSSDEMVRHTYSDVSPVLAIVTDDTSLSEFIAKPSHNKVPWLDVMKHIADRVFWENIKRMNNPEFISITRNISMNVLTVDEYLRVTTTMSDSPVVMLVGVTDDVYDNKLMEMKLNSLYRSPTVKAIIPFNCSSKVSSMFSRFGEFTEESQQAASSVSNMAIWLRKILDRDNYDKEIQLKSTSDAVVDLWARKSSDDLLFLVLVLIDTFTDVDVRSVKSVTAPSNTGIKEVLSIIYKLCCGQDTLNLSL
jgi:hypothetical protein